MTEDLEIGGYTLAGFKNEQTWGNIIFEDDTIQNKTTYTLERLTEIDFLKTVKVIKKSNTDKLQVNIRARTISIDQYVPYEEYLEFLEIASLINDSIVPIVYTRVKSADETKMYRVLSGHDCHPDDVECCDECLRLNGFDGTSEFLIDRKKRR